MTEVQSHGFIFEDWVKDTFFDGYRGGYSDKWDVPQEFNEKYKGLPVSIKTAKYGSTIGLGDACRQFNTKEDFLMIVGFWKQEEKYKRIVNVTAVIVEKELWAKLWKPVTLKDLIKLDFLIKDTNLRYAKARKMAQDLKKKEPYSLCEITLNPKIDSKTQRRLQCGIRFGLYFDKIAPTNSSGTSKTPTLWGIEVPKPWESESRIFHKKSQN